MGEDNTGKITDSIKKSIINLSTKGQINYIKIMKEAFKKEDIEELTVQQGNNVLREVRKQVKINKQKAGTTSATRIK